MRFGLTLVLIIAMTGAPLQAAADVNHDWSAVRMLSPGARLKVESNNGKSFEGTLQAVSETSVTVSNKGKDTEFPREDTRRVYVLKGKTALKSALTGTAIGAGGGAAFGAAVGGCDPQKSFICFSRGETAAAFGVVGAVIGAVSGALAGAFRQKRALVYDHQ